MLINTKISGFLYLLRDDEHLNLGVTLTGDIKVDVTSIPALVPAWNEYEPMVHHEDLIFQVSKASPETRAIYDEDKLRDIIFRETKRLLNYYSVSPDATRKAAADSLLFVLQSYKVADKRNIFGETAYIRNFLSDLSKPEHAAEVAAIPGLGEMLADLATANTHLDVLYNQRLHTIEELEALGKRVDIRKDADYTLINLFSSINTVYHYNELTTKDPVVKTTLERVAARVKGLNDKLSRIIAQRSGKHKASGGSSDKPADKPTDKPGGNPQNPTDPQNPTNPQNPTDPQNPNTNLPAAPDTPNQNPGTGPLPLDPNEHPSMGERISVNVNVEPTKTDEKRKK